MDGLDEPSSSFDPRTITRPDEKLMTYYIIVSVFTIFGFPFVLLALFIRYKTLRYRIDDEGVSMSVGLLFKKEVLLTYRRIQDIHVERNIIHRWLGLAKVSLQTASGASGAEMTLEGILEPEQLRDFLYTKMRGARGEQATPIAEGHVPPADEALQLLHEIRDAMAANQAGGAA
ncbi:MAG: PH domain-containing protein [Phycisphaerales bacterium]|nr:PH domain-containing protein [Phycisphaerales bacterium]